MTEKEKYYLALMNVSRTTGTMNCDKKCMCDECDKQCDVHLKYKEDCLLIENLIKEHFDNPPLELNDLEIEKPYWDNEEKEWCFFVKLHKDIGTGVKISVSVVPMMCAFQYKENRFYRKQVEDE